ncbi:MAG: hypothetical protein LQ343_000111 [Gyalolechia ehrenbergii]|nr:MAG: hypothetical protein LQ343_000111 [Gyalolechia ehrenbergii]
MKSMIISAIVGFAALNINGVSGAVVPAKAIKRLESSGSHSEATGDLHSAIVKRDTAATGGISTVNVPVTIYPDSSDKITKDSTDDADSAATTCVHTTQGFIQCGDVISKRDTDDTPIDDDDSTDDGNSTDSTAITCVRTTEGLIQCGDVISKRDTVSTPSINNLSKRVKMKQGFADLSDFCAPDGYHWVQRPNPGYCWELNDMTPDTPGHKDLWNYCYARVKCDKDTPEKRDVANNEIISRQSGGAGCHAHGQPLYFQSPSFRDLCNAELVKGCPTSKQYNPGAEWNMDLMNLCFVSAGCDGGDAMGSG